jgi:hypothetical protein
VAGFVLEEGESSRGGGGVWAGTGNGEIPTPNYKVVFTLWTVCVFGCFISICSGFMVGFMVSLSF